MQQNELKLCSCEYIMETEFKKKRYLVDQMLYPGLYILAGAPKVGKSWLAMQLCVSVALGNQFLKHETDIGQAVYLALEDDEGRLQDRVYEFIDVPTENLEFAIASESIDSGLENQIRTLGETHNDLRLVIIDTMQKVRETTDISYAKDYKDMSVLKNLATELGITIILIHHTCKHFDDDPFKTISGTMGLSGCVDGSYVLVESKRGSRVGKLYGVGRDFENIEMSVAFRNCHWYVTDTVEPFRRDTFSFAIHDLMVEQVSFVGSATALCELLYKKYGGQFYPNRVTRDLVQHTEELKTLGVSFTSTRSHGSRIIKLEYDISGDAKSGALLYSEVEESTGTQKSAKALPMVISQNSTEQTGDGNCPFG